MPGLGFRFRRFGYRITKGLRRDVERSPGTVVVADFLPRSGDHARSAQLHDSDESMPVVAALQFLLEEVRLLDQRHLALVNMGQSFWCSDPYYSVCGCRDGGNIVVWQPALAREIVPAPAAPPNQSLGRPEPDGPIASRYCGSQVEDRKPVRACKRLPTFRAIAQIESLIHNDDEMVFANSGQRTRIGAEQPAGPNFQVEPILALAHQSEKS